MYYRPIFYLQELFFIPDLQRLSSASYSLLVIVVVVVVVALLFYVHGKHLRSCLDGQLT